MPKKSYLPLRGVRVLAFEPRVLAARLHADAERAAADRRLRPWPVRADDQ